MVGAQPPFLCATVASCSTATVVQNDSVSSVEAEIVATEVDESKKEDDSAEIQVRNDSSVVSEDKRVLDKCSVTPSLDEVDNGHDPDKGMDSAPFNADNDDGFHEKTKLDYVDFGDDDKGINETEELVMVVQ